MAYPLYWGWYPSPLRMPPIYDILTGKKGGQSLKQSIRKKNSGKNFHKIWVRFIPRNSQISFICFILIFVDEYVWM